MTPSPRIVSFVKGFEKCRLHVYMPTPDDHPTIGWGTTGADVYMGMADWTQQQCDSRFTSDFAKFAGKVGTLALTATQNQFDAMVSLAYNIGVHNFAASTVLREHLRGNYAKAQAAFAMWNKQHGEVLDGLTRRRAAEAEIYGAV